MKYREIEQYILDLIGKSSSISEAIEKFLEFIARPELIDEINILTSYNYEADILNFTNSILSILETESPKIKIEAYWFGIFETTINRCDSYQAYISATNKFDYEDDSADPAGDLQYFPVMGVAVKQIKYFSF